jgi:hypothetical protein
VASQLIIVGTHQSIKVPWIQPLDLSFKDPIVVPIVRVEAWPPRGTAVLAQERSKACAQPLFSPGHAQTVTL